MDPNFFADSDPDFKNKDPDPTVFTIRFPRNKIAGDFVTETSLSKHFYVPAGWWFRSAFLFNPNPDP